MILLRRSDLRNGPRMIFSLLTSFEGYYRITQHKIDTRADCWLITVSIGDENASKCSCHVCR